MRQVEVSVFRAGRVRGGRAEPCIRLSSAAPPPLPLTDGPQVWQRKVRAKHFQHIAPRPPIGEVDAAAQRSAQEVWAARVGMGWSRPELSVCCFATPSRQQTAAPHLKRMPRCSTQISPGATCMRPNSVVTASAPCGFGQAPSRHGTPESRTHARAVELRCQDKRPVREGPSLLPASPPPSARSSPAAAQSESRRPRWPGTCRPCRSRRCTRARRSRPCGRRCNGSSIEEGGRQRGRLLGCRAGARGGARPAHPALRRPLKQASASATLAQPGGCLPASLPATRAGRAPASAADGAQAAHPVDVALWDGERPPAQLVGRDRSVLKLGGQRVHCGGSGRWREQRGGGGAERRERNVAAREQLAPAPPMLSAPERAPPTRA